MRRSLALLACSALLAAACVDEGDDPLDGAGGVGSSCEGSDLAARDLLDCVGDSVALVETPYSGGSAVLLDDGYLVTNAHVVDPYGVVDLTFPGGESRSDVPVVGVDAFADIAVVGPVDVDVTPLALAPGDDVAKGEDVYLIGFPGEFDAEPEPAISRGVLSRTRRAGDFDLTYLQTDASIGGGQSGGALVDPEGRVIGISGLAFAEEFALALDGADVQDSVDRILEGDGDPYSTFPDDEDANTDHSIDLVDELDGVGLYLAPQDKDTDLRITAADGVGLDVVTFEGEPLLINSAAAATLSAVDDVAPEDLGIPIAQPVEPGVYQLEVPADIEVIIYVSTVTTTPSTITVATSLPTTALSHQARGALRGGKVTRGVIDALESADMYLLELAAGESVSLTARSPSGDLGVYVRAPGQALTDIEFYDDGGGGLYDYDALAEFDATTAGTYLVSVITLDGVVTGYELDAEVTPAAG